MFRKVLVAEDMDDVNQGVYTTLSKLDIAEVHQTQYCDDAYLKIKKSYLDDEPYELLVTDLSFKVDHREQNYPSGEALIEKVKSEYPDLKVIAYSVEDRLQKVRTLVNNYGIEGYVCKGRNGLKELSKAITSIYNNELYLSEEVKNALSSKLDLGINEFDIELMEHLAKGLSQDEISALFKKNNISPSSLSSIEKHLNKLRIQFGANNAIHLVAIVKDLGLI
ncbi:MAG: response regulator [Allomuricauda sp.]